MLLSTAIARWVVKRALIMIGKGEAAAYPALMKAIDSLGDQDGQVELFDLIKAASDYVSDIGDAIMKVVDNIDFLDLI